MARKNNRAPVMIDLSAGRRVAPGGRTALAAQRESRRLRKLDLDEQFAHMVEFYRERDEKVSA